MKRSFIGTLLALAALPAIAAPAPRPPAVLTVHVVVRDGNGHQAEAWKTAIAARENESTGWRMIKAQRVYVYSRADHALTISRPSPLNRVKDLNTYVVANRLKNEVQQLKSLRLPPSQVKVTQGTVKVDGRVLKQVVVDVTVHGPNGKSAMREDRWLADPVTGLLQAGSATRIRGPDGKWKVQQQILSIDYNHPLPASALSEAVPPGTKRIDLSRVSVRTASLELSKPWPKNIRVVIAPATLATAKGKVPPGRRRVRIPAPAPAVVRNGLFVSTTPIATQQDVEGYRIGSSPQGARLLALLLNAAATKRLAQVTTKLRGQLLYVEINGHPVMANLIVQPITAGMVAVSESNRIVHALPLK